MKNLFKFALCAALLLTGTSAFAQTTASDSATTTAIIVDLLKINATQNLHFGEIFSPDSTVTAIVTPEGAADDSGGAEWQSELLVKQAIFVIEGRPNATLEVSLPLGTYEVTNGTPAEDMLVGGFAATDADGVPIIDEITLDADGAGIIWVGATLTIAEGQPAGTYTNTGGLLVTVNY